ncbi:hypothetical protein AN958_08421 [Leucoagaricus sp. SymC.cos]|nr:hypothetical protein AN958_08421 [Leucoagaricus sp. SymC.cos]
MRVLWVRLRRRTCHAQTGPASRYSVHIFSIEQLAYRLTGPVHMHFVLRYWGRGHSNIMHSPM